MADSPDARIEAAMKAIGERLHCDNHLTSARQLAIVALAAADAALVSDSQSTEGDERRATLGRDPRFLEGARAAREFYEERGLAQSTEPTPALDIDAIAQRAELALRFSDDRSSDSLRLYQVDVPALVAEVRRGRLVATNLAEALRHLQITVRSNAPYLITNAGYVHADAALSEAQP